MMRTSKGIHTFAVMPLIMIVHSSPLKLHWELDKAPKEYFGETEEGIPEYERRKEV